MRVYQETTSKFAHFEITHLGEGEEKSKFGVGHYASIVYDTAALYAGKCKGKTKYIFILDVPELTDSNHIVSAKPTHTTIIRRHRNSQHPLITIKKALLYIESVF